MTATIIYQGNLRCDATHLQSNTTIQTDAPTDNRGKGQRFSPTDLVCTALGTCMITTMAMKATDMGIELQGTTVAIKKYMLSNPRRIGKIDVQIMYPTSLILKEEDRIILQKIGDNCPVMKSLQPAIEVNAFYK